MKLSWKVLYHPLMEKMVRQIELLLSYKIGASPTRFSSFVSPKVIKKA